MISHAQYIELIRKTPFNPTLHKLPTASSIINITGVGGLDWSTMIELQGPPSGGKSTYAYQSAQEFLEIYGDRAVVLILDAEGSANHLRLGRVFGLRISNHLAERNPDPRVRVELATTFEQAVEHIIAYTDSTSKNDKFLLVIWDSITMSKPKGEADLLQAQTKAIVEAQAKILAGDPDDAYEKKSKSKPKGGKKEDDGLNITMNIKMLRPQMLKWAMSTIMATIYQKPVLVFLVNQATSIQTQFGMTEGSGGGYGFKHGIHYSIKFKKIKKLGDNALFRNGTLSILSIEKSKVIPSLMDVQLLIRDEQGGRLDAGFETVKNAAEIGYLEAKNGGWFKINQGILDAMLPLVDQTMIGDNPEFDKFRQMKDFTDHSPSLIVLNKAIEQYFRSQFQLLNWAYEEREEVIADLLEASK